MDQCLLIELLLVPAGVKKLSLKDWDSLIPQARATALSASLYARLRSNGLLDQVPERPLAHLYSAWLVYEKQKQSLNYELKWLLRAYKETEERFILLKGAAYIAIGLPLSDGRLMSDIDLLVPERGVGVVEAALNKHGWLPGQQTEYDERYYRQWMHEIPPLGHMTRESTLDVHHTILPPTANSTPEPLKLFSAVVEVKKGIFVLAPIDMVIHSATHLFHEGDFQHGLRDLWDLDRLLRHYGEGEPDFWERLAPRAEELKLSVPLYYALRYTEYFFKTPIPEKVVADVGRYRPAGMSFPLVDFMFKQVFVPDHSSCPRRLVGLSSFLLYVRSHYLRMPLYLLIPHLIRKAWAGFSVGEGRDDALVEGE